MTDDRSLDMTPRVEFADRLEADLLRAIGARDTTTTTHHVNSKSAEEPLVNVRQTPALAPRRPVWMLAAAAASVIVLVLVGVAFATRRQTDSTSPAGSHKVTFTVTWSLGGSGNWGCAYAGINCLAHFTPMPALSQFAGDIKGRADEAVFWNEQVNFPGQTLTHAEFAATYGVFATVQGCGTGAGDFMVIETLQGQGIDRSTRDALTGDWQIVPKSGRGPLATISGDGTSSGVLDYGATPNGQARTFTGTISCP